MVPFLVSVLVVFGFVPAVLAQAPPLGSEFIFFVEGRNVSVPADISLDYITDPTDPANRVVRFNQGNWNNIEGFDWPNGIDLTANIAAGDSIFFKVWSSPVNSVAPGKPRFIMLDSSPDNRINFRLYYNFPDSVHTGRWVQVAVPFPPATRALLDSAKVGKNPDGTPLDGGALNDTDARWQYWGAYDDAIGVIDQVTHPNWREFNFNRVRRFGFFWDQPDPSTNGPIFMDDFYIGRRNTDLEKTKNPPPPAAGLAAVTSDGVNTVSWTRGADISAYNVYFSGSQITDVTSPDVFFWKTVNANDVLSLNHRVVSPHPDDPTHTYHYAVTATNLWSTENTDVTQSRISVAASGPDESYIFKFTPSEEAQVLNSLDTRTLSTDGFPVGVIKPFELKASTSGASVRRPPNDEVVNGKAWVGYGDSEGEVIFYVYIEVMDNDLVYNPIINAEGALDWNSYKRDQVELRMGSYAVNFVTGPTNRAPGRGENPDYTLAFRPTTTDTETARPLNPKVYVTFAGLANYPFAFEPIHQPIMNGETQVGYRILAAFEAAKLREPTDYAADAPFTPPGPSEIAYMPFSLMIVDDANDTRPFFWEQPRYLVTTSWKPNFGTFYFEDPSNFSAVAIAGANRRVTSIEDGLPATPGQVALAQNYPNPFNPATSIRWQMPDAGQVSLTVHDLLGRTVAVLADGVYPSGSHTVQLNGTGLASGMYLYTLEVGNTRITRKMLLMK
jgi:hypothetical protein